MARVVDNLIAYRFLSMLVKPFTETQAYALGIIDENGNNLIKSSQLKGEQKDAYTYLHRLAFNLKKLLNKLPGGDSKFKNMVAALVMLRESYPHHLEVSEEDLQEVLRTINSGVVMVEEELIVRDFMLCEDAPTNVTGPATSTDQAVIRKKPRRFQRFVVNDDLYNKFSKGKTKYRRWKHYLNLEDDGHRQIYEFAKKNPRGVIILHNGKQTKAIRFNRRGGGAWHRIRKTSQDVNNEVL